MCKALKSAVLGAVCVSTALAGVPAEALAGPLSVAPPDTVGLSAPTEDVHYRRYPLRHYYGYGHYYHPRYRYHYYYPRYGYYPSYRYGYNPAGAMFAGAALGLMGAGLAAATAPRWGWGWGGPWGFGGGFGPWGYGGWGGPFFW